MQGRVVDVAAFVQSLTGLARGASSVGLCRDQGERKRQQLMIAPHASQTDSNRQVDRALFVLLLRQARMTAGTCSASRRAARSGA